MKEYKVTVKTWYTGGILPDLFGKTHPIAYEMANSAKELHDKYVKELESIPYSGFVYKIDIQSI